MRRARYAKRWSICPGSKLMKTMSRLDISSARRIVRHPLRVLLAVLGVLVVAGGIEAASIERWRYAAGDRTVGSEVMAFEMYWRGSEAVVRAYRDGSLTGDVRCVQGTYQAVDYVANSTVVREGAPVEDCLRWATGSATDGRALARDSRLVSNGTRSEAGRTLEVFISDGDGKGSGVTELVVDRETGLPRSLARVDGETITWAYRSIEAVGSVPELVVPKAVGTETYRNLTIADAAAGLGRATLPARLQDFEFYTAFRYVAEGVPNGDVHVLWVRQDGGQIQDRAQIQVWRGEGVVEADELGITDMGGAFLFKGQLGKDYVQVLAPDLPTLKYVLSTLGL